MLQVLGRNSSINVRKVLWVCHELGLPYELQQWGTDRLPTNTLEFRALNPNAMIPVIRDGEFVLWESNSICRYLVAEYGHAVEGRGHPAAEGGRAAEDNGHPRAGHGRVNLLPVTPRARALVEQWMDWQVAELNPSWSYAVMALVRHSPARCDPAAISASVRGWNRQMGILDEQLHQTGAFVTGADFTLADIVLGLSTNRWFMTPMERPDLPAVAAYYERLSERPGFLMHGRNGLP